MARASKDHIELLHDYGIHVQTRTIWLESSTDDEGEEDGVNYHMAMRFLKNFHLLEKASKDPIIVIMNTGGGNVTDGMAIYDAIRGSKCHITIKVYGVAESMGCIILQAADHRTLMPHARLMFHQGPDAPEGNNTHEIYNSAKSGIEFGERMDNIIYEKIKARYEAENKAFTRGKFNDMNWKSKYMNAEEAVALGLADEIEQPSEWEE